TGTWITAAMATDPEYWVRHLRQEVRFAEGVATLLNEPGLVLLEVGPGRTLGSFARQQTSTSVIVSSLPRAAEASSSDMAFLLTALGRLWLAGVDVAWQQLYVEQFQRRVPLPTYPFERQRYWLEPPAAVGESEPQPRPAPQKLAIRDWFSVPIWKQT